jgi:hypothetical protein
MYLLDVDDSGENKKNRAQNLRLQLLSADMVLTLPIALGGSTC